MSRRIPSLIGLVALVLSGGALVLACSSETNAKEEKVCKPDAYVFCRCQDRQEGSKLCNETGTGFGKCEPCETEQNPEIIDPGSSSSSSSSGDPFPQDDGGSSSGNPGSDCGDGIVQAGEDCDDKNTDDTDGCGKNCKLSGNDPPATLSCPGLEVHVWGGAHKPTTTGSTVSSGAHDTDQDCANGAATQGGTAPDRVFKVVAHKTGTLSVTTTDTTYDSFLYVASSCVASNVPYLACANKVTGNGGETLQTAVEAGKTYYVFVDGYGTSKGNFRVTFEIP